MAAAALGIAPVASAIIPEFLWIGGSSTNPTNPALLENWLSEHPEQFASALKHLRFAISNGTSIAVPSGQLEIHSLYLSSSNSADLTISGTTGAQLAVAGDLSVQGTGSLTLNSNLDVLLKSDGTDNHHTIDLADADITITLGSSVGEISSPASVTKTGPGTLVLSGSNSFTGSLSAEDGTLVLAHANARASGDWTIYGPAALDVNVADGLSANEVTTFYGATLNANAANAVSGGTQRFYDEGSASRLFANVSHAVTGGSQLFYGSSYLLSDVANGVSGGSQYFEDTSSLNAWATNSVTNVTVHLYDSSVVYISANDALSASTNLYFNGGDGTPQLRLRGYNTEVGYINSGNGGTGEIVNRGMAPATLTVNFAGTNHFDGSIWNGVDEFVPGALSLTKKGSGTLVLNGSNTYTGSTTIDQGSLRLGHENALPDGTKLSLGTYASLEMNGFDASVTDLSGGALTSIEMGSGELAVTIPSEHTTFGGSLNGTSSAVLKKDGAGTLVLEGHNYFGSTKILAGTLKIDIENSLRTGAISSWSLGHDVEIASGAMLRVNYDQTLRMLTGAGTAKIETAKTLTVNLPGSSEDPEHSASTFAGALDGGGAFVKAGPGKLTLSGNSPNYAGAISVQGGQLFVDSSDAAPLGQTTTGTTVNSGASLIIENSALGNEPLTLAGYGTNYDGALIGHGNASHSGAITFVDDIKIGATASTDILDLLGVIGASSNVYDFTKVGEGTVKLSAANTFSSETRIDDGILLLNHSFALQNSTLNHNGGGTLSFGTLTAATLGGLAGWNDLALTNSSNQAVALTIGNNNEHTHFSGVLSGNGSIVKIGNEVSSLDEENTYTGLTTINSGTLEISQATGLGSTVAGTQVNTGATLLISGAAVGNESITLNGGALAGTSAYVDDLWTPASLSGTVTLAASGASMEVDEGSELHLSGAIAESGGSRDLRKKGYGTLVLTGASTYTGSTQVEEGTLEVGPNATNALPTSTALGLGAWTTLSLQSSQTIQRFLGSVSEYSEIIIAEGQNLTVSTPTSANDHGGAGTFPGEISGYGGLIVDGVNPVNSTPGTVLVLTGDNWYEGGTTINGGTLQIGNGGNSGTLGWDPIEGAPATVLNNGHLVFYRSDHFDYHGIISGSGGISLGLDGTNNSPAGILTLTGQNIYSGNTRISSGTLNIGAPNTLPISTALSFGSDHYATLNVDHNQTIERFDGTGSALYSQINLAEGSTLTVATPSGEFAGKFAGLITGEGSLVVNGANFADPVPPTMLTLTGTNTYSGGTIVNSGLLALGDGGNTGTIYGNVSLGTSGSGGGLVFNRDNDYVFSDIISGKGSVTQGLSNGSGDGTTFLLGANTYEGGTYINRGVLIAGHNNAFGNANGIVNLSGGVVAVNSGYIVSNPLNLNHGVIAGNGKFAGTGALIKSGVTVSPESYYFNTTATLEFANLTLAGGGTYRWNILDEHYMGPASSETNLEYLPWSWDHIEVSGALTFDASLSSTPFTLELVSLSDWETAGMVTGFENQSYSWTILSASSINGTFDPDRFVFDTSSFQNNLGNGAFALSLIGNDLVLNFTPVPEPSTWAMMLGGSGALALLVLRRRRSRASTPRR